MKNSSASKILFSEYTKWISTRFLEQYGTSYATQEQVRNNWRYQYPYSTEAENFLLSLSKMFISTLDSKDSNSTNPAFLKTLTNLMADYLSAYTMSAFNNSNCTQRQNREKAKKLLKHALFDDNTYIQNMLIRQSKQRFLRAANKNIKQRVEREKRKAQAREAHDLHLQVQAIFVECATLGKKY